MARSPIHETIELLEKEIERLDARRAGLMQAIASLLPLSENGARQISLRKTNERTNERAKHTPTGRRLRSLPDVTKKGEAILTALRAKSPQSPRALAKVLKLASTSTLNYQLKPLLKNGAVVATGKTLDRQFSLPPRSGAAKEAP